MALNSPSDPEPTAEDATSKVYGNVLQMFSYFGAVRIDLLSLIRTMQACGCRDAEQAQKILTKMCREGFLDWKKEGNIVSFARTELGRKATPTMPPGPTPGTAHLN